MSKINKKSINYGLKILTIFAFILVFIPFNKASAENLVYSGLSINQTSQANNNTEWQIIDSINPSSANRGANVGSIIITGNGFSPSSVARVNGSNRSTTFIDNSHLLVQLNSNDTNRTDGGFYVTVFDGTNGNGSYSNSAFFTVNYTSPVVGNNTNSNNSSNNPSSINQTENTTNSTSDLASNAIFGSGGFLPSGIIQWILFAIIILVIVVLVRKVFGAKQAYEELPMKYE